MRISGGSARGIVLQTPPGDSLRPATGYLRQALFSSLGTRVQDAAVLDCFAGSGAYGLEAWSRGAAGVTFIENNRQIRLCLQQNIQRVARSIGCNADSMTRIIEGDFLQIPPEPKFGLVFADPPYPLLTARTGPVLERLWQWLSPQPDSLLLLEGPGSLELPESWQGAISKTLRRGPRQPAIYFLRPG